jgi:hypothetical protein
VLVVVLISFRVWSSSRISGLIAMAAAVMTAVLVAIVLFGVRRIFVLVRALVFVVRDISSFVDTVGRHVIIAAPAGAQLVPVVRLTRREPSLPQVFKVFPVNLPPIRPAVLIQIVLSSVAAIARVMRRD